MLLRCRALLALVLVGLLTACAERSDVRVLKIAHSMDANHPVHQGIVRLSERVNELSGGDMRLDVYSGGQIGSERELMELLQIGSLAMAKVSSSPMEGFVPEMKIFSIPYVFRSHQHYWRVLEGEEGERLLRAGESVGLRGLGYFDGGARSFYTVNTPVHEPDDLKGQKIRVQPSQTSMRMVRTLSGSPTPIAWGELYTALSQGVVDGAENNPPSFYASRHYEVTNYYSLNEHTYVPDMVLISTYIWNKLNQQEQRWLEQAMDDASVYQRKVWAEAEREALEKVREAGTTVIHPDKQPFIERVKPLHASYEGTGLYELIQTFKTM